MRRTLFTIATAIIVISVPLAASAQQWSAEQQEVWDAEVACLDAGLDDPSALKACIHPDFMGWGVQRPVPIAQQDRAFDYGVSHNELKVIQATPLHILVEGDLAIIQLVVQAISSTDNGPDETTWVAWTDIMRRDDGKWRWIADHGHRLGDDD
jgi:hypothetical protein